MSHGWGAATVGAIVENLVGLQQTAPGYKTFTVKPRLGGLANLSVKIPTPHGALWVNATGNSLGVAVPCNSQASLCLPTAAAGVGGEEGRRRRLALDGVVVAAERVAMAEGGTHACVMVGCGAVGEPRRLTWAD